MGLNSKVYTPGIAVEKEIRNGYIKFLDTEENYTVINKSYEIEIDRILRDSIYGFAVVFRVEMIGAWTYDTHEGKPRWYYDLHDWNLLKLKVNGRNIGVGTWPKRPEEYVKFDTMLKLSTDKDITDYIQEEVDALTDDMGRTLEHGDQNVALDEKAFMSKFLEKFEF